MLLLQFDRLRHARLVGQEEDAHGQLVGEVLLADRNPPLEPGEGLFRDDLRLAALLDNLDLVLRAHAQDQVRAALEQLRDHPAVLALGLHPGQHLDLVLAAEPLQLRLLHIQDAALARVLVRERVDDDDRIAGLVGGDDRLLIGRGRERRMEVGMIELEAVGVVLRAAGFGVDDREGLVARHPLGEAHRGIGLAAAAGAGQAEDQADALALGRAEGDGHAGIPSAAGRATSNVSRSCL
ncbi:MAG TPA: hypothetical protein VKA83_09270 [Methylomirabilota bacterium]|nr:hypothetical protein [Methylomirabilota bacterium]